MLARFTCWHETFGADPTRCQVMRISRADLALAVGAVALILAGVLFRLQLGKDAQRLLALQQSRAAAIAESAASLTEISKAFDSWLQRQESLANALTTLKTLPPGSFDQIEIRSANQSSRVSLSLHANPAAAPLPDASLPDWLHPVKETVLCRGFCPASHEVQR